jgi:hypothetical protein
LRLCGYVKDVIMSGTNLISQSGERRQYEGTRSSQRIDLVTGGFP